MPDAPHSPVVIRAAAVAVTKALNQSQDLKYALVGGSACVVLGSDRATEDVDFVVIQGQTPDARQLLRGSSDFTIQPRTNHTTFTQDNVDIEILAPPVLFKETFDQTTEVITIDNMKVLKPALILNAKCRSILGRANLVKRGTDSGDIIFLLELCAQHAEYRPKAAEVPNATGEFVQMFSQVYGRLELWSRAGYDLQTGLSWLFQVLAFLC